MAILVADNFQYQGRKPLDSRIIVDTVADMKAIAESIIYEGILVYNKETKKYYQFDPANTVDITLGKWREFSGDSGSGNALILEYTQDTAYLKNTLIVNDGKLYIAALDFTSSNLGPTATDDFALDLTAKNLTPVSAEVETPVQEYKQSTAYKKDTLVYCGDRLGRVSADFTSDTSKLLLEDSFALDVSNGNIIVDKIDISELDEQLLKALPIVAFVTKHDIPRFESNMIISGSIPKFRDGTALSTEEKKGCNFLYIVDANNELTGLAMVMNYDETADEFTVKTIHANAESDAVLEEDIQANIAIGAAAANFKYPKNMTFTEFVKKIAFKDILVSLNFTATGAGLIKKGTTINGSTLSATLTALGNVPIEKIKFYDGNTQLSEQTYVVGTTTYTDSVSDNITTDKTFAVVVEQEGNRTVRKEAKLVFVNPTYVGAVSSLTPTDAEILAFTENLKEYFKGTYTVSMADARTCISYPSSMGNITSIKDKNNFEYINSFTKTTRTLNGETYNVYVLTDAVTADNFTWTIN